MTKTNKELAYLHELFVATDWGERFAELLDEHVKMPKEGKVLYLAAGTGAHAIALQERSSNALEFVCVDENSDSLDLAQAKATALGDAARFQQDNTSWTTIEEIDYESGEAFLNSPLIAEFLMPGWLGTLPAIPMVR